MKAKDILTKSALQFLETYLNTASPTGFEWKGQRVWTDYLRPYVDELHEDNYGTCYGVLHPRDAKGKPTPSDYKVVIEAHADEISWFVNYITDKGLLHVIRNGGSDQVIAPSKRVLVHLRDGKTIEGLFGWPAIHTRKGEKEKEVTPKIENITVDVGARSKEEVEKMGIHVGCVITYPDAFHVLNDRYFVCRALDNRAGGFMIAQVARLLHEQKVQLPYSLYIINSVQEEVGLYGAKMIAQTLKPNVAIVTDVTHDTSTPMIDLPVEGDVQCGKGPVIGCAPSIQQNLLHLITETAAEKKIPVQWNARSRSSGTDTDAFAFDGNAVSALISLPLRYMHTTVEMVDKDDVAACIHLMYESLQQIRAGQDFRYLKLS
ncbi:M20/M25/M40 family metallo-hydrolase [Candidatus Peribacteria bacterium]|nr:M20/M25/M40 family metallo-hydrolase [Candidatus Peribacteria bacterium]